MDNNPVNLFDPNGADVFSDIGNWVGEAASDIGNAISSAYNSVSDFLGGTADSPLGPGSNGLFKDIGNALSSIGNASERVGDVIVEQPIYHSYVSPKGGNVERNWENNTKITEIDNGSDTDNWFSNARTTAGMFLMWATGYRLPYGVGQYYENDGVANAFRNADIVMQARDYWYQQVKDGNKNINSNLTNFKGESRWPRGNFGAKGYLLAGIDPIEQFVGSFSVDIQSNGRRLKFILTNTTSMSSGTNNLFNDIKNGPGSNFHQTYIFTEPINFDKIK